MPHVKTKIREMNEGDVRQVAAIHEEAFVRQLDSREWIAANFAASPRTRFFVAEREGEVVGYLLWMHKSGFRREAVLDLEQIAVSEAHRGEGVGTALIEESLAEMKAWLSSRGRTLKSVLISTRTDNTAQRLYRRVLNAETAAVIRNLYSYDEVLMVAESR